MSHAYEMHKNLNACESLYKDTENKQKNNVCLQDPFYMRFTFIRHVPYINRAA